MDDIAIKVEKVSKVFKLPHDKQSSVKSLFVNIFKSNKSYEIQKALNDVSFEVKKGEFFGIVGRNGSGKSTLLKLIAGIYSPTEGGIHINGSLTPFIELGVGFNPELTGRENVYLNGALLGFNRKEMNSMYKDIVNFAELEKFMDQKLKNYSSGMQVRLAFSIAIRAQSDIILLDEVLAVGDNAFQKKCREYFRDVKNRQQTVVLVTHDMKSIEDFCDRAMLVGNGQIRMIKNPKTVVEAYEEINRTSEKGEPENLVASKDYIEKTAKIKQTIVRDPETGHTKKFFKYAEEIEIVVRYEFQQAISNAVADIGIRLGREGPYYFYTNSQEQKNEISGKKGSVIELSCKFKNVFHSGSFYVASSLYDLETLKVHARNRQVAKFDTGELPKSGLVYLDHELKVTKAK
jgi:ABC-2 type transport system ATP-binding protein